MFSKKDFLFKTAVILSGMFSGILFILHQLIIWYRLAQEGKIYSFFSLVNPDPLVNLAPMIRAAIDGQTWISDGRIFEHMRLPNLWSFLDPLLIAPLNLIAGSISFTFLSGHFLSALATFFIVYFLAKRLIGSRIWSLFFSIIFSAAPLLGYYLFPASIFNLKLVARTLLPLGSYPGEILMSKYISFSVLPGLPFFAGAFYLLFLALDKKEFKYIIFAGLSQGLLIYIYLTDVMYLFTAMGIMALLFAFHKQFAEIKKIIYIILIALGASLIYWWNFLNIKLLPWAEEFYLRLGGEATHAFRFSRWREYFLYMGLAALIWFLGKKLQKQKLAIYLIGFVLSAIVLFNLQVITGFNPAPTAWPVHQFYFGFSLAWLVLLFWIYKLMSLPRSPECHGRKAVDEGLIKYVGGADTLRGKAPRCHGRKPVDALRSKFAANILCAALIAVALSATLRIINTQIYIASYLYPAHAIPSNIFKSLEWLNKNTPTDSVVGSPSLVSNALLPAFTHNNVILPTAVTSPASQEEITDRLLVVYAIYGVDSEYLRGALSGTLGKIDKFSQNQDLDKDEFAQNQDNALNTFLFESYYTDHSIDGFSSRFTVDLPSEVTEQIVKRYESYPLRLDYLLNRYQIDYLYVGPYEKRFMRTDFSSLPFLKKVYDQDGVIIYKIDKF